MEQRPSWEASQEIPCLLCNLKDHYHDHKSPLLDPILNQINTVHILSEPGGPQTYNRLSHENKWWWKTNYNFTGPETHYI